ncbi:MAG: stage III sporulation protein AF [Clostridia bacterium]|nr:stage III sporulation protein AF [Clostridia bacterium]
MTGYILSILGIVVAGVFIDIIVPAGTINKYIKGIYSIFVVAVLISPVVKFLNKNHDFTIKYEEYNVNDELLDYIFTMRATSLETNIEKALADEGFSNVDIKFTFSIENNELKYNSCNVNLKNLVISADNQHINKYEFIKEALRQNTNLTEQEIIFDE